MRHLLRLLVFALLLPLAGLVVWAESVGGWFQLLALTLAFPAWIGILVLAVLVTLATQTDSERETAEAIERLVPIVEEWLEEHDDPRNLRILRPLRAELYARVRKLPTPRDVYFDALRERVWIWIFLGLSACVFSPISSWLPSADVRFYEVAAQILPMFLVASGFVGVERPHLQALIVDVIAAECFCLFLIAKQSSNPIGLLAVGIVLLEIATMVAMSHWKPFAPPPEDEADRGLANQVVSELRRRRASRSA